jgi:hypothetical protein
VLAATIQTNNARDARFPSARPTTPTSAPSVAANTHADDSDTGDNRDRPPVGNFSFASIAVGRAGGSSATQGATS